MKRIIVGALLIAAGFLGGLLAQPPAPPGQPPGGFRVEEIMRRIPVAFGTVASIQGNIVTVQSRGPGGREGPSRQVTVTNQTQIQRSQPGTKADIKANAFVLVIGQPDPKSGWMRADQIVIMPTLPRQVNMLFGRVYDVKGGGDQFGVSAPITLNPKAQVNKLVPVKPADIKQGEQIFVQGTPDEAGNLVAETIILGEMPFRGMGGMGGFGRPGGMGDRPRGSDRERPGAP